MGERAKHKRETAKHKRELSMREKAKRETES